MDQEGYWDAGNGLCGFCIRFDSWWLYGKARQEDAMIQELKARPACGEDDVDFTDQISTEITFLGKPHYDLPLALLYSYGPEFLDRVYSVIERSFENVGH